MHDIIQFFVIEFVPTAVLFFDRLSQAEKYSTLALMFTLSVAF